MMFLTTSLQESTNRLLDKDTSMVNYLSGILDVLSNALMKPDSIILGKENARIIFMSLLKLAVFRSCSGDLSNRAEALAALILPWISEDDIEFVANQVSLDLIKLADHVGRYAFFEAVAHG